MRRIYLDHSSTTPTHPAVRRAMRPYLAEGFGNASSLHGRGIRARQAIEDARAAVADLVRALPGEIIFTGSASEANNLALKGIAQAAGERRGHFIAPVTEHISVLHPLRTLARQGFRVTLLAVDRQGAIDPDDLRRALAPDTLLVTLAHASAEIGTVQALSELCRVAHAKEVPVHCDATATAGHLPWADLSETPDLVTLTPHLFYGPQGVGALRVKSGVRLAPLIEGGTQEGGLRAGTEPLAAIVGCGAAAGLAADQMAARAARATARVGRLRQALFEQLDGIVATGHPTRRIPGHLSLCVHGLEAELMLRALDDAGIEAASGSPCTTEARKPSQVLEALGIDPVLARGALTLSFGEANREQDPEAVADLVPRTIARLRQMSPLSTR
jgi:cysteine desulfurase